MPAAVRRCLNAACCVSALAAVATLGCWRQDLWSRHHWASTVVWGSRTAVPRARDRLFGAPLKRLRLSDGSLALEPEAYGRYYPDVGDGTADGLAAHFLSEGRRTNRVPGRLRVLLSYEAAAGLEGAKFGGLCNQIYSHVGMLAVGLHMGAEVVLPDAVHRGGRGFQDSFWADEVVPVRAPLGTLLDVDHLLAWGASVGAVLHTATSTLNVTIEVNIAGASICCLNTMEHIVGILRGAVLDAVQAYLAAGVDRGPNEPLPPVALHLHPPKLMFALRTDTSHTELIEEVARNLWPAPAIRTAADAIVAALTADGAAFNGIHLRMEADAGFQNAGGGDEAFIASYIRLMEAGNCTVPTPLYIASGLLTYMNASDFESAIVSRFTSRGVCGDVVVKEQLLDERQTRGLMSEALALIDLLVLVRARFFAGFWFSSFSWVVQEYRCLSGLPTATAAMVRVNEPWIPGYFEAAGALGKHSRTCPDAPQRPRSS